VPLNFSQSVSDGDTIPPSLRVGPLVVDLLVKKYGEFPPLIFRVCGGHLIRFRLPKRLLPRETGVTTAALLRDRR
jgi:hypothetical protein